jgi:hypothetical protein
MEMSPSYGPIICLATQEIPEFYKTQRYFIFTRANHWSVF